MEYTNSQITALIDEHIHNARDRRIMKLHYVDGLSADLISRIDHNKDMLFGKSEQPSAQEEPLQLIPSYSYAPPPENVETTIEYTSDTEFGRLIYGRNAAEIWPIIDELVSKPVQAFSPRLYDALFHKLKATKSPG